MKRKTPLYIRGWKGLVEFTGYHERTLRRWHYERAFLPVIKTQPHSKTSKWITTPQRVETWLEELGRVFKK